MSSNIYTEASNILLTHKSGSLKSRIYSAHNASQNSRASPARLYALIMETLKYQDLLNEVIKNSGILSIEKKLNPTITLLLLHDHLLLKAGKDCISLSASHPLKSAILRHKARLNAELTRSRLRRGFPTLEALKAAAKSSEESTTNIPRWVRVNTVKTTLKGVLSTTPFDTFTKVESLQSVFDPPEKSENVFYVDAHIPNLLAFPVSMTQMLTSHHLYTTGALILQDKASCFPAYILNPPPGAHVIDACAAPGNKTTHLAAIMSGGCSMYGKGRITAFEKDPRRSEILSRMVNKAGANGIVQIRKASDFLKSNPQADPHVGYTTHLLLDPSCSGSGITSREQAESSLTKFTPLTLPAQLHGVRSKKRKQPTSPPPLEPENQETSTTSNDEATAALSTRLLTLSGFQLTLLLHALSFPHATRITYSTCSIYFQENEHVVVAALLSPIARERGWKIDSELSMLKGWERRGIAEEVENKARGLLKHGEELDHSWVKDVATGCVRCDGGDGTGGFFVACFVRESNGSEMSHTFIREEERESQGEHEEVFEEWEGINDVIEAEEGSRLPTISAPKKKNKVSQNSPKRVKLLRRKK
ncbi:S-adenosyl-L-methionine-dependent methyltransferase [Tirmania nivea]|nr:S-adenosyl-L-methionine-dependent methyltransferase [Tirmania nivea]